MQIDGYSQPRGAGFSLPRRHSCRHLGVEKSLDAARKSACATKSLSGSVLHIGPQLRSTTLVALFALEDEGDRLALRPRDDDRHGAIGRKRVAFQSNRAGLRRRHLQDVVIPPGLALEVFAGRIVAPCSLSVMSL